MSVADDLKAAKAEMVRRGRGRIILIDSAGRCCPLGAIGLATISAFQDYDVDNWAIGYKLLRESKRAQDAIRVYAAQCPESPFQEMGFTGDQNRIWRWNDILGPTDDEVLTAFDRAAA